MCPSGSASCQRPSPPALSMDRRSALLHRSDAQYNPRQTLHPNPPPPPGTPTRPAPVHPRTPLHSGEKDHTALQPPLRNTLFQTSYEQYPPTTPCYRTSRPRPSSLTPPPTSP